MSDCQRRIAQGITDGCSKVSLALIAVSVLVAPTAVLWPLVILAGLVMGLGILVNVKWNVE